MTSTPAKQARQERPPVVAVMGHIDHGKSTLLDYIRKSAVVEGEAGGITQHLSAYEAEHSVEDGTTKKITFLDTPGHAAFEAMRSRGSEAADIAILVVAADDGVKPQTREALASIRQAGIPFVVAITKIDVPSADTQRTKGSLVEHEVYLEGMGGDVPFVAVSSKTGEGIAALMDMVLLVAELEELTGDPSRPAEGVVIESNRDAKKGISATLIIKDGTLRVGQFVVAGGTYAPVRMLENFLGESVQEASFSQPVRVVGFSDIVPVGAAFAAVATKKEAEAAALDQTEPKEAGTPRAAAKQDGVEVVLPLVIKADTLGTLEAIEHELGEVSEDEVQARIIRRGVGSITEADVMHVSSTPGALIIGFAVGADAAAREAAERYGIEIAEFDIIYELTKWLAQVMKERAPEPEHERYTGRAKVLKTFSQTRDRQVIGCRVEEGTMKHKQAVEIHRGEQLLGEGTITSLQEGKTGVSSVAAQNECGAQIVSGVQIASGDVLRCLDDAAR